MRCWRWLDAMGFKLAPNQVVDARSPAAVHAGARRCRDAPEGEGPGTRDRLRRPEGNDYERLARDCADVRAMQPARPADIVRIDRAHHRARPHARTSRRKLAEAMHDSAVRVSLAARLDGAIVGFLMARADLGDFGRTEPVAVLDTIGVDPGVRASRRRPRAVVAAVRQSRAHCTSNASRPWSAPRDLELLGFLYGVGFAPSQRLPFVRRLD